MSWVKLDTKALVSLRESFALRIAEGGLPAALSPPTPVPETSGDTAVARGELCNGELLALSLPRPVEDIQNNLSYNVLYIYIKKKIYDTYQ